ncbi:MAG: Crp/Fnr family transcriptional regulator [Spirochaetia bacterium]
MAAHTKDDILAKLKQIPLFEELKDNDEQMNSLMAVCRIREHRENEVIIKEGDLGTEMFIVYKGGVEIKKRTRAGDDYTVVTLKAEYNVFFGEMALIDDDKRSATVIAGEDSVFLVITKNDFLKLGNDHPEVGLPITRAIAKILAGRLRKTTSDMVTIFDALVNELSD